MPRTVAIGGPQADADTSDDAARAVRNQHGISACAHSSSDYRAVAGIRLRGSDAASASGASPLYHTAKTCPKVEIIETKIERRSFVQSRILRSVSVQSIFDRGRREAWFFSALAAVLVLIRSVIFLLHGYIDFDSDQAIVGLMAKHLSEFRTFPLFFYGQNYMLGAQSWVIAPFFWVARPSIAVLKTPLVLLNVLAAILLVRGITQPAGDSSGDRFCRGAPVHPANAGCRQPVPADPGDQRGRAIALHPVPLDAARPAVRVRRAARVRLRASRVHDVRAPRAGRSWKSPRAPSGPRSRSGGQGRRSPGLRWSG